MSYYESNDTANFLSGLIFFLVIVALLVYLAVCLGTVVLIVFLSIGGVLGLIYALIIYIRALKNVIPGARGISGKNLPLTIIKKWFYVIKNTSILAIKDSVNISKGCLTNFKGLKFLSFTKWMWLIAAIATLVFGLVVVVLLININIALCMLVLFAIVWLICMAAILTFIVCAVVALVQLGGDSVVATKNGLPFTSMDFTKFASIKSFFKIMGEYYVKVWQIGKQIWSSAVNKASINVTNARGYAVYNVWKYILMISPFAIFAIAAVLWLIEIVLLGVIGIPVALIQLIWIGIASIIRLF